MKLSSLFALLTVVLLTLATPVLSQTPVATTTNSPVTFAFKPIDTRFSTLNGMTYVIAGEELHSYADLKAIISPLKDYEADRLLAKSQSSDELGHIFRPVGLLAAAVGVVGVLTASSNGQTPYWITAASGGVMFDIGTLFGAEAETAKFNAVQRYNRFAYGREQVLPQTPSDEKSLLPISAPSAVVTPLPQGTPNVTK